jgi:hypothetical protein
VAGDFNTSLPGDEIGLYNAGKWAFDNNGDRVITDADLFITGGLLGYPVVGDFDGDERDDLAVYNSNAWHFDLANDGLGAGDTAAGASLPSGGSADRVFSWGLAGTQERPVAADMDQDGIDDIGLWQPGTATVMATWRFLISNDPTGARRVDGDINTLTHAFSQPPNGSDSFAQFGGDRWRPVVGNFDPPAAGSAAAASGVANGDWNSDSTHHAMRDSFQGFRSPQRVAPIKRFAFGPTVADAALADLNLVSTKAGGALAEQIPPFRNVSDDSFETTGNKEEFAATWAQEIALSRLLTHGD